MNKVLLYYPKVSSEKEANDLYVGVPLSVMTLAAQLDPEQYDVKIIDGRLNKYYEIMDLSEWMSTDLVMVGISAMTSYQIYDGLQFSKWLRDKMPCIPIVWGGWHASLMPEQTICHRLVDFIMLGQGEYLLPDLLMALEGKKDLSDVPNLIYKDQNGNVVATQNIPAASLQQYQSIIHADKYVDIEKYIGPLWRHNRVLGYESSRGCPWHCKYCSIGSIYNRKWNALSPERMINDIKYYKDRYSIDAIHFYDNNFFVDKKRVASFCELLINSQMHISWDGTCNVEQFISFSDEFMHLLKKSGFFRVIIGIESGDPFVLKMIGKTHTNKQVIEATDMCNRWGIMPSFSFMVGFPWDPETDVKNTITLIEEIRDIVPSAEILLFIFTPYCGTEMFEIAKNYGMEFPQSLEVWSEYTYDHVNTPWISDKLKRKIDRYITFFGTKNMSNNLKNFYTGEVTGGDCS